MHLKYANGKKRNENDNNGVYTYGVGSSTVANVVCFKAKYPSS